MRDADDKCQAPRCRRDVPPGTGQTILTVRVCRRCAARYNVMTLEAGRRWLRLPPPERVKIEGHPLADAPVPHVEPERQERKSGRRRALTVEVEGVVAAACVSSIEHAPDPREAAPLNSTEGATATAPSEAEKSERDAEEAERDAADVLAEQEQGYNRIVADGLRGR